MKIKDIKTGDLFVIDNTMTRPKLKLKEGYLDIASLMIWTCREETEARVLTDIQIEKVRYNWKMKKEDFEKYNQMLIRRYIKEVK